MNGRIYDPTLGRFLQADPHIQAPTNSQNYNRYSYVLNNPMSYTDPSGYFFKAIGKFVKKHWRTIVAAVATVVTYGAASGWVAGWGAAWGTAATATSAATLTWAGGAAAGAIAGFVGGAISTGSLRGAVNGALSGAVFGGIGASGLGDVAKVGAHALGGGVLSDLQGGNFGHGFWMAGVMKVAGMANSSSSGATVNEIAGRATIQAMVGGTLSRVTGGKFANGAISSAIQYVVNGQSDNIRKGWKTFSENAGRLWDEFKGYWSDTASNTLNELSAASESVSVTGERSFGSVKNITQEASCSGEACSTTTYRGGYNSKAVAGGIELTYSGNVSNEGFINRDYIGVRLPNGLSFTHTTYLSEAGVAHSLTIGYTQGTTVFGGVQNGWRMPVGN